MFKLIFAIIIAALTAGCSKQPLNDPDPELAVTGYISNCDSNWHVVETHVMIHWHRVTSEALARFKVMAGYPNGPAIMDSTTCPNNAVTWWVVGRDTCATVVTK